MSVVLGMAPSPWWRRLVDQVRDNARLRIGLWAVIGLLWVYLLMWAGDWIDGGRASVLALQEQAQRLRPLRQAAPWQAREQEAREELKRLQALAWRGADRGLVEAKLQDWVRSVVAKSGLGLRELRLMADDPTAPSRAASAAGRGLPASTVRLHAVVEFQRVQALALLSELARQEPIVVVERLTIRTTIQPATLELDLRALVWPGEGSN